VTEYYGLSQVILAVIFILIMIFRREGLLGEREIVFDRLLARGGAGAARKHPDGIEAGESLPHESGPGPTGPTHS
jgi:hypothetical protein